MATEFHIRSLSTIFISYEKLSADWRTYRKDPERFIHRFISINQKSFRFLGVKASYEVQNFQSGLLLQSSMYIGAAPLLSPVTGKPAYDLNVTPIYSEDLGNIISLLGERIEVEFNPMKLLKPLTFQMPMYFECIEYMKAFKKAIEYKWTKFDTKVTIDDKPSGSTDWGRYARESVLPECRLRFANVTNYHTQFHSEWQELTTLLKTVIEIYKTSNPPIVVRSRYNAIEKFLYEYVRTHPKSSNIGTIRETASDPPPIKELKASALRIISQKRNNTRSWRIEISVLFERFVQFIIEEASRRSGWRCHLNEHYVISNPSSIKWVLRYIEPDIVLTNHDTQWVIDAKYKSHMFNTTSSEIDILKTSFREDYHQVLSYTSFATTSVRKSTLVYPSTNFYIRSLTARSPFTGIIVETKLIGLPFKIEIIEEAVKNISELLNNSEIN